MNPKSGKPLRLFVNPLSIWTDFALKSGEAMLASAQAAVARKPAPKVGVIHSSDAPPRKAARAKTAHAKTSKTKVKKARKSASSRARRRAR
jgi:hypothetical protein